MKRKQSLVVQVLPRPNQENFMICVQYVSTGPIHTDDNFGAGYTLEEAQALVEKAKGKSGFEKS